VWLEAEGRYAFGIGIAQVLQAVDRSGSIKQKRKVDIHLFRSAKT
jgi:molybdenum-dependent DNA-binding transcriptional regulator ModE